MPAYPAQRAALPHAAIRSVEPGSAFDDEGFTPGCILHSVDGCLLRDVIDWRWLTGSEDEICVEYTDADGDSGELVVVREPGQAWGVEFESLLFDGVKTCRNACTFCFMRQLPDGMRGALAVRDDDFRLSFLTGTFVTLTNLTREDEERIIEQNLSPLRFSLHAFDADVRQRLIGRHEHHGLEAFARLARAGIRFDVQIVLVPGVNDGSVLDETLAWAARQDAIEAVGVVPLGYTRFQSAFDRSYGDASAAARVLGQIGKAQGLRSDHWVFAADEFYVNAYPRDVVERIPPSEHYGGYEMFEDGVGMVRTFIDDWNDARSRGLGARAAEALSQGGGHAHIVFGEAMRPIVERLMHGSVLEGLLSPLIVRNDYFGGNVTVTGLLTARDIVQALSAAPPDDAYLIPRVIFNDAGVTLDDQTAAQLSESAGRAVYVVSCNPTQFLSELIAILENRKVQSCLCP